MHSLYFLLLPSLIFFSSCFTQEANENNLTESEKVLQERSVDEVACPTPSSSVIYSNCAPYINCTRQDLDPCDYANMELYANAVCCELTKFINGCPPTIILGCDPTYKCFGLNIPAGFLQNHPNSTAWRYCAVATCSTYTCEIIHQVHHVAISIADQDILITYLLSVARDGAPYCGNSNVKATVAYMNLYYVYTPPLNCSQSDQYWCTNIFTCKI